jgi:phosphohistidine phosphatase
MSMTGRTLVLLRHAKAETPGDLPDFDRRLTTRGRNDSDAAGSWLAAHTLRPDLVLCSPATRTRQTWQGVAVALATADPAGGEPEVHYERGLYDGGRTELVDLLRAVPDTVHTVLVIGHNPTMSDVSILLRPDRPDELTGLRTCGLAVHRPSGAWSDTEPGSADLVQEHTARA